MVVPWQGRREAAYQLGTWPTEDAARGRTARPGGSAVLRQALPPLTLVSDRPRGHGAEGRVAQDEDEEGEPADEEKAIRFARASRGSDEREPGRRPDRVRERSDRGLHAVRGPGRGRWARVRLRPCAGGRPLLRRGGRRRSDDGTRCRRWGDRCGRRRRSGARVGRARNSGRCHGGGLRAEPGRRLHRRSLRARGTNRRRRSCQTK